MTTKLTINFTRKARNYCFTLNNPTEKEMLLMEYFAGPKNDYKIISYIIFGEEIAPTTGTKHLQGYFELTSPRSKKYVNDLFGNRLYLEERKGSQKQAIEYCKKDGKWIEGGTPKNQGGRNDLIELKNRILNGETTVDEITLNNPIMYHQYGRTLNKIEDLVNRDKYRTWMTTCNWYFGPTGVGKSHTAFDSFDIKTHYVWEDDNGWQDAYAGQETVIINDFRGNITFNELLKIIDKYPHKLRRRCREPVQFLAKHIIITSSLHPSEIYHNISENDKITQLYRRIKIYTRQSYTEEWCECRTQFSQQNSQENSQETSQQNSQE